MAIIERTEKQLEILSEIRKVENIYNSPISYLNYGPHEGYGIRPKDVSYRDAVGKYHRMLDILEAELEEESSELYDD